MKKILLITALIGLPLLGFSQDDKSPIIIENTTIASEIKVEKLAPKKATIKRNSKFLKINYKKSNDIISIKAYRKSLHVRVRTKKLC